MESLKLSIQQLDEIGDCLTALHWETHARCVILADITGQVIEAQGSVSQVNTAVLSALAAGELAATKEMARLIGEEARFKLLLHEGLRQSVYLSDVGEEMVLVTVFASSTPIGMVRLFTRDAVDELKRITKNRPSDTMAEERLVDFGASLSDEMDSLLKNTAD
ncbi:MAG: roadblock/LC7 domain-containing protein [Anaerolineae bacterium]|nr:roadblock/LC7 domain-containing protein [Anaerolineae bacterium]